MVSHMQGAAAQGSATAQDWCLRRVCTLAGRLPVCAVAFSGSSQTDGSDAHGLASARGTVSLACACLDGSLFVWNLTGGSCNSAQLQLQVASTVHSCVSSQPLLCMAALTLVSE